MKLSEPIRCFFDFCIERHAIYIRRQQGDPWPWTENKILQTYKFTNVYRQLDRGTLWLTENIIEPYADDPELFFNIAMYRSYNHWPFAELLMKEFGYINNDYSALKYKIMRFASKCMEQGIQVFTGAHIVAGGNDSNRKNISKIERVFDIQLDYLWEHTLEVEPSKDDNLESAFNKLNGLPGFGDFIAYEVITDLRHTRYLDKANDIMTWANPGPGATRGIMRIAGMPLDGKKPTRKECIEAMVYLRKLSDEYLPDWMPRFELRDAEHALCEFSKYERTRLGEGRPRSKFIPPHLRNGNS